MPHTPRNVQGPYTAADFWAKYNSVTPRMNIFIKITPRFGDPVGLAGTTRDMTLPGHPGITFKAKPGISPSVLETALDEPTNLDMTGIYESGIFEHTDVLAGKWNFAQVEVFTACWANVNLGELVEMKGNLGELKDYQTYFIAEGRGLLSRLSNEVDPCTNRFCRVKRFRDGECGHTASTVTIDGDVYDIEYVDVPVAPRS